MIRPIDYDRDVEAICSIMGEFDSDGLSPASLLVRWRDRDQAVDPQRLVWQENGTVLGYMNCRRWRFMPEGTALVDIGVTEGARRRGIGRALMELGLDHGRSMGWSRFLSRAKQFEDGGAERFLESFGFEFSHEHFESMVEFESMKFDGSGDVARLEDEGYRFVDYVEMGDSEKSRRTLHQVQIVCDRSEPSNVDFGEMDFESFCVDVFELPGFTPEVVFVALKGDDLAGAHWLFPNPPVEGSSVVGYTGVMPEHREKGLSKALKWKGIEAARALGWRSILTYNDSRNGPMLAVNEQYGFRRMPGWTHYRKELTA